MNKNKKFDFMKNAFEIYVLKVILILFILISSGCEKENLQYFDDERTIEITKDIIINNGVKMDDPIFNYQTFENFIKYLASSDHFLVVPQKDFAKTTSDDKVILSLRYDIDNNINAAVKFAYREHKYGIKSTYYILHTAKYYGKTGVQSFKRNDEIIHYLTKIQDSFGHEIGLHNDLLTLQVVYDINPKIFLADQLKWLRDNSISVTGSCAHGSPYCYIYHYLNSYFWKGFKNSGGVFYNYEYVNKDDETIQYMKDDMTNYDLEYDGDVLPHDYFFSDVHPKPGEKRWHMGMVDFDTIQPGKKVIILLHPEIWD